MLGKSVYFQKMFAAHDTIKDIREKIDNLRRSAEYISPSFDGMPRSTSDSKRLEKTIVEIADLRECAENLLRERARFDLFVSSLAPVESKILNMRYRQKLSWKEISCELKMAVSTAKGIYYKIETKSDDFISNSSKTSN